MKKFLILCLVLFSIVCVSANNSQANFPVIDDDKTVLPDNVTAKIVEVKTVTQVKAGDNADTVNNIIAKQNNAQTNAGADASSELKDALKQNGYTLPSGAVITGDGFMELELTKDDEITNLGLTFTVNIPEISNSTSEVGLVHYSSVRGFEYVKASSYDKSTKSATFTLADTSPIAFVVAYNNGGSGSSGSGSSGTGSTSSGSTNHDGRPVTNTAAK